MNTIPNEHLIKLIEVGIQAPSGDNWQPWKFKLLANGFELWLDPENMGEFFDVNLVATEISCGALIENVVTLATALGLATHISYFNNQADKEEGGNKFAKLTFTPSGSQSDVEATRQAIFNRRSNRNLYQFTKKIPTTVITELTNLVTSNDHYKFYNYQTPQSKSAIIDNMLATDAIRFANEHVHNDFHKALRFGKTAEQTRNGLAAATLGIESFMFPVLKLLKPWKITRFFNHFGLHHIMTFRATWLPMKSSSHIVGIVHQGPVNYVEAGRIMQRFWLQVNKLGLSLQLSSSLPLFLARYHLAQGEGFTSAQLKSLAAVENDFAKITPGFNKETDQLIMLFRLGYTKHPAPTPYRREVESFLI